MSCGHCVKAVTQAVHEVDPKAHVDVDLQSKHVNVDTQADRSKIVQALAEAGYQPA
jgi:copper chaperone